MSWHSAKVDNLKSNELRNITRKKREQSKKDYQDVMIAKIHSWQKQLNKLRLQSLEEEPRAQLQSS